MVVARIPLEGLSMSKTEYQFTTVEGWAAVRSLAIEQAMSLACRVLCSRVNRKIGFERANATGENKLTWGRVDIVFWKADVDILCQNSRESTNIGPAR